MKLISSAAEIADLSKKWHKDDLSVGLVPTMGWFHEGHLSLMRAGRSSSDRLVVSLFVNPIQFGPGEDLDSYPRDLERDRKMAESIGVDVLYAPRAEVMYPHGFQTLVRLTKLSLGLCGGSRPGHFDGVCTVVSKLFNQVRPDCAFFGEKDFQQLAVIRRMVFDLDMGVEIVACPIVREESGLALSSRNVNLKDEERESSLCLIRAIRYAKKRLVDSKQKIAAEELIDDLENQIRTTAGCTVDYVKIVDSDSLQDKDIVDDSSRLIMAVKINDRLRLIDNSSLI